MTQERRLLILQLFNVLLFCQELLQFPKGQIAAMHHLLLLLLGLLGGCNILYRCEEVL